MSRGAITRSESTRRRSRAPHELKAIDGEEFAATRQTPEMLHHESRDRIEAFFRESRAEVLIELFHARHAAHGEVARVFRTDVVIVLDVKLVIDLADDRSMTSSMVTSHRHHRIRRRRSPCDCRLRRNSFKRTLSRFDSGTNTAGRMYSRMSKLALASAAKWRSRSFREEYADDVVAIRVHDRKARKCPDSTTMGRMRAGGSSRRTETIWIRGTMNIAHLQIGDRQHALEHLERIRIHKTPFGRLAQQRQKLGAILGFPERLCVSLFSQRPGWCSCPLTSHAPVRVGKSQAAQHGNLARSMRRASRARSWS